MPQVRRKGCGEVKALSAILAFLAVVAFLVIPSISDRNNSDAEWLDRKVSQDMHYVPRYVDPPTSGGITWTRIP